MRLNNNSFDLLLADIRGRMKKTDEQIRFVAMDDRKDIRRIRFNFAYRNYRETCGMIKVIRLLTNDNGESIMDYADFKELLRRHDEQGRELCEYTEI